jgi:ELWxxDGT repeat protein
MSEVRTGLHAFGDGVVFARYRHAYQPVIMAASPAGVRALDVRPAQETRFFELYGSSGNAIVWAEDSGVYSSDGTRAGTRKLDLPGVGRVVGVAGHLVLQSGTTLYAIAPGATQPAPIGPTTAFVRELGGFAYFGRADGLYRWSPGGGVEKIGAGTPVSELEAHGLYDLDVAGGQHFWPVWEPEGFIRLYGPNGRVPGFAHGVANITAVGPGRVVFWAWDDRHRTWDGAALWVADANGMRRLSELWFGDRLTPLTPTRTGLVFPGWFQNVGTELLRTDGTVEGTVPVADVNRLPTGSAPAAAAPVGDRVVFRANRELWATDGTADGTTRLRENGTTGDRLSPWGITSDGTTAYFTGADEWLHRTDGTPQGTRPVAPGFADGWFSSVGWVGSAFVFNAKPPGDSGYTRLYRTDGTAGGTRPLRPSSATFVASNAKTLLMRTESSTIRTDGLTTAEERGPRDAVAVPGGFLASGFTADQRSGLFALDEDGADPRLIAEVERPEAFARVGQRVLFVAGPDHERRWHSANLAGGDITRLSVIEGPGYYWSVVDDVAYLSVQGPGYDVLLYRTDGTNAGTTLLHRFADAAPEDHPDGFAAFAGAVWFSAYDPEHGRELWRTDGTAAGTVLAADIDPGQWSSEPRDLVAMDDFLFFTAYDKAHGVEPWRVRLAAPPPPPGNPPPPVTIAPVAEPERAVVTPGVSFPVKVLEPTVLAQVRKLRGARRWRVTGQLQGTGCTGRVRIDLGRGSRRIKTVTTRVRRCRFAVTVGSRTTPRWVEVRTVRTKTVAAARSGRVTVR